MGVACPYVQSIPYVGKLAVPGIEVLSPVVDLDRGSAPFLRELKRSLGRYGVTAAEVRQASIRAEQAQAAFTSALREKGRTVLGGLEDKAIVIIGRSYNALERGMNLRIPEKLASLGVLAIPMDMLPLEQVHISAEWPDMYWRSGQRILRAARFIAGQHNLYPIVIGNFSCGPDSFIHKHLPEAMQGKPFLYIEIDEHSADAGVITRCEAYLDSIANRPEYVPAAPLAGGRRTDPLLTGRTVYIPHMTDHARVMAAVFQWCGVPSEVLPEPDESSREIGMRYVSGKECYPCTVTTGDMVKKVLAQGFEPSRSAFFMPAGSGPCRFGQYNVFHKKVLAEVGYPDVPVFAPNQDNGIYDSLSKVNDDFVLLAWKGIVAVEMLQKCLHETRPYEQIPGTCDAIYGECLSELCAALREGGQDLEERLKDVRERFQGIPRREEHRPRIGVIGEVYVRLNRFANEDVIKRIEAGGGEAWLTSFDEWIYYINAMGIRRSIRNGQFSQAAKEGLKRFVQTRIEHRYAGQFLGFLQTVHEPSTRQVLRHAAPYLPDSFEGEAVLSIGKSVALVKKNVAGIINAIPFGCMPGTIVAGMMQVVKREHDLPFITLPFDGTESATNAIQLEAFMEQAKARSMSRNGKKNGNGRVTV